MDIEENWPYDTVTPHDSEAVYDILTAYEGQLDRIDVQADELHDQRFLQTATTRELEKLAAEVGVQRETGEGDDRLRFRALIGKAVTRSSGTIEDIGIVLHVLFSGDATNIEISVVEDQPVLRLTIPTNLIDDTPLTTTELETELSAILPVGDSLSILTDDTWLLGESGSQGLGEGKLT